MSRSDPAGNHAATRESWYVRLALDRPVLVIVVVAFAVALIAAGAARLTVTNDMRAYFSEDNPQLKALDRVETVFDKQDNVHCGYTPSFNTLNLLRVPTVHSVGIIAPFAALDRLSITGWLRSGRDPMAA